MCVTVICLLKTADSSSNVVLNKALKRQNIFVNKIHAKIVNIKHMRCHTEICRSQDLEIYNLHSGTTAVSEALEVWRMS